MRTTCTHEDGCDRPEYARGLCSRHYQHARYHGELPPPPQRQCKQCGELFTRSNRNARFCSAACKDAASGQRRHVPDYGPRNCERCEQPLPDRRRRDMRFCSARCSDGWNNARKREKWLAENAAADRRCAGCGEPLESDRARDVRYCSRACRIRSRRHEAYGLTRAELDTLLAQHEQCAICGGSEWGRKGPQVDHCHKTGRVRGVLCINCNNGLGRFADDPARLRAAAQYLESHVTQGGVVAGG